MLRSTRTAWWAWDARPFPAFPGRTDIWSDGANHGLGHWLNGRLEAISLADLLPAIAARQGVTDLNVAAVQGLVDGFVIDRPMSGRDALENLLEVFALDVVESEGRLKVVSRAGGTQIVVAASDIVDTGGSPSLSVTRMQETDVPRSLRLAYVDSSLDYRAASVQQVQTSTASVRELAMQLPAAVPQSLAQQRVDIALAQRWSQRETAEFALPPRFLNVEPGDVLALDGARWRVDSIEDGVARACSATRYHGALYEAPAAIERVAPPSLPPVFGAADVLLLDLAMVQTAEPAAPWAAAQAKPWPGQLNVLKQQGGGFALNRNIAAQATMGVTLTPLPTGILGRVDHGHVLDVRMDHGALASVGLADLLGGANAVAIGNAEGGYEIIQFAEAQLLAANVYRLSGLLRAQAGSWPEMLPLRASGQRIVLLNAAVVQVVAALQDASLPASWRIGPAQHDHAHPSYVSIATTPTLKALRPLRPSHLRLRRTASGLTISWIRQTRQGGDSWDLADVPLAEASENYDLQMMQGSTLVRRWTPTTATQIYAEADVLNDFGSWPAQLQLRVAQTSALTGNGPYLERTLNV